MIDVTHLQPQQGRREGEREERREPLSSLILMSCQPQSPHEGGREREREKERGERKERRELLNSGILMSCQSQSFQDEMKRQDRDSQEDRETEETDSKPTVSYCAPLN